MRADYLRKYKILKHC